MSSDGDGNARPWEGTRAGSPINKAQPRGPVGVFFMGTRLQLPLAYCGRKGDT